MITREGQTPRRTYNPVVRRGVVNVIAEFRVRGTGLLLGRTLAATPGIHFQLEQHTANERGHPVFFGWVQGEHASEPWGDDEYAIFEESLTIDETVEDAAIVDEAEGKRLYRVEFARTCFYGSYRDTTAKFLTLVGTESGWSVRMRFPDHERFAAFRRYFVDRAIPFTLFRLYHESEVITEQSAMKPAWEQELGLTSAQRDTLIAAYEGGYYDDPRRTGVRGLAAEFGVSPQAVAGRLRRAHRNLVENVVLADADGN